MKKYTGSESGERREYQILKDISKGLGLGSLGNLALAYSDGEMVERWEYWTGLACASLGTYAWGRIKERLFNLNQKNSDLVNKIEE